MAFNEQRNKNKAKVWTVVVHILLMLWFAFYGLTYQDPPPEEGIAINFGYEETGAGENTQAAPTIPPPTPTTPVETPPVQEEVVRRMLKMPLLLNPPMTLRQRNQRRL